MSNLELPLGKRTPFYRFFEILPGAVSYSAVLLLIILSLVSPTLAAAYLLLIIITMAVKAMGIAYRTVSGYRTYRAASAVNWHQRLGELEDPAQSLLGYAGANKQGGYDHQVHLDNLQYIAEAPAGSYPRPSQLYQLIIIATYNESFDVLDTTVTSLLDCTYDPQHMIVVVAYEARGGQATAQVAARLQSKYAKQFHHFMTVEHPQDMPHEVVGKGPNITYAAQHATQWITSQSIPHSDVIVTTLDSDNRPHPTYFDYLTYEYIVREDRQRFSYQPLALFFGNIWDAPAPMRVIATGNSFWTIISSMRPHTLRNFASHSQPLEGLIAMNFWSKRSIVEDGHQYWRSYFHFRGDYDVLPLYVPVYQDAVMADTLKGTLIAQFKQLRRWAYGASDIPYVAVNIFTSARRAPFWPSLARFLRLLDSHVSLASVAILVAIGGWVPLILNPQASRDIVAHQLPEVVSLIQRVAMVGLFISIFLSFKLLPPRPARYKRRRTVAMALQWLLMPITSIAYSALSAYNAQTHLMLGKYLDKFDVTDKATFESAQRAKATKRKK